MIGLQNRDSSFFTVDSNDVRLRTREMSRDLISFALTERIGALPQGTLSFYDKHDSYSRILRTGANLRVTWGYRNLDLLNNNFVNNISLDEISGSLIRRGYSGFVTSPGGSGGSDGVKIYNCNFTSHGFRGIQKRESYSSGTKASVVLEAMVEMGIPPTNAIIDFDIGTDAVTEDKKVYRDNSAYRFLTIRAKEWRAVFSVAFDPAGIPFGVFVSPQKVGRADIKLRKEGATGSTHNIGYKGELNNVISYTWKSNESQSGVGQNIVIDVVDGQPVFRRFIAAQETVITYKLDVAKVHEEFEDAALDGFASQNRWVQDMLNVKTFAEIERFFVQQRSTTAPQGFGYKIQLKMIGNALYSTPNIVSLKNGFPGRLGNSQTIYYLNEVSHKIDRSGYNMSCEIVDAFTFSQAGIVVL